jgi:protein subunit release factor B
MLSPETIEKVRARMSLASVFEEDIEESFILGSGPGGQKTNKTSSTVRLHHAPSGLTVKYGLTRSREANRWLARRELAEKILEREHAALSARKQAAEKIRRQKRRRSRRQKAKMLDEKRRHGEKKATRGRVPADDG